MFSEEVDKQSTDLLKKVGEIEKTLRKEYRFIQKKLKKEMSNIRTQNKTAEIQALKRKELYELVLQKIDDALFDIEIKRRALEEAKRNAAVLETLKFAADALKAAQQHKAADQVHNMEDEIAEQRKVAKEISQAISKLATSGEGFDEVSSETLKKISLVKDKLEREREEILQERLDGKLLDLRPPVDEL